MNVGLACVNRVQFPCRLRRPCGFHFSSLRVKQADVFFYNSVALTSVFSRVLSFESGSSGQEKNLGRFSGHVLTQAFVRPKQKVILHVTSFFCCWVYDWHDVRTNSEITIKNVKLNLICIINWTTNKKTQNLDVWGFYLKNQVFWTNCPAMVSQSPNVCE